MGTHLQTIKHEAVSSLGCLCYSHCFFCRKPRAGAPSADPTGRGLTGQLMLLGHLEALVAVALPLSGLRADLLLSDLQADLSDLADLTDLSDLTDSEAENSALGKAPGEASG